MDEDSNENKEIMRDIHSWQKGIIHTVDRERRKIELLPPFNGLAICYQRRIPLRSALWSSYKTLVRRLLSITINIC